MNKSKAFGAETEIEVEAVLFEIVAIRIFPCKSR